MGNASTTLVFLAKNAASSVIHDIDKDLDKLHGTSGRVSGALGGLAKAAGLLAVGGIAAGGAAIVASTKAAADFESQLNTINTVAQLTPEALADVGDGIRAMARETGASLDDLTQGYYDLVSAGVDVADAQEVLKAANTLAVGGLATTAEAVDLLTTALNSYGMEAEDAAKVSDLFAESIASGKVTAAEISESLARVAPMAAASGIELEEVAASYALLTKNGVPAAEAATQMRGAISALLTPNKQLNDIQEQTGINFAEMARTQGLQAALERMRQAFADNGDALAQLTGAKGVKDFVSQLKVLGPELGLSSKEMDRLAKLAGKEGVGAALQSIRGSVGEADSGFAAALGRVEAFNYALLVTGDNADAYAAEMQKVGESTGLAAEQAAERQKGLNFQLSRIHAIIGDIAISVGNVFLPAFTAAAEYVANNVLPAIESLGGAFEKWLQQNAPLVQQVSTFVSVTLAGLATFATGTLIPAILQIAGKMGEFARTVAQDVGPTVGAMAGKLAELVTLIVTKVVPVVLDLAERVWEGGANRVFAVFYKVVGSVIGVLTDLVKWIVNNEPLMEVLRTAADLIGQAFGIVADVISAVVDGIGWLADAITSNERFMADLAALGEIIGEAFRIAGEAIAAVSGILDDLVTAVQDAIDAIAQVPGVELISDIIGNVGKVIAGEADKSGEATGKAYATGIKRSGQAITQATRAALGESARILRAASPPGPESPLHEIDVWGMNTGKSFGQGLAAGIMAGIPAVKGALSQMGATITASLEDITQQALAAMDEWASGMSPGALRRAEASGEAERRYFEALVASGAYQWDIGPGGGLRVSPTGTSSPDTILPGAPPETLTPSGGGAPVVIKLNVDGREMAEVVDRNLFYKYRLAT